MSELKVKFKEIDKKRAEIVAERDLKYLNKVFTSLADNLETDLLKLKEKSPFEEVQSYPFSFGMFKSKENNVIARYLESYFSFNFLNESYRTMNLKNDHATVLKSEGFRKLHDVCKKHDFKISITSSPDNDYVYPIKIGFGEEHHYKDSSDANFWLKDSKPKNKKVVAKAMTAKR